MKDQKQLNIIREEMVRALIATAGSRIGLCDFRPEKKGPFGRFMVKDWQRVDGWQEKVKDVVVTGTSKRGKKLAAAATIFIASACTLAGWFVYYVS